jgi:uncharacterized protein YsxB (DUF464 family)
MKILITKVELNGSLGEEMRQVSLDGEYVCSSFSFILKTTIFWCEETFFCSAVH